jgi:twitching motility protein PilT
MAATGHAPISILLESMAAAELTVTHELLAGLLRANDQISDLIFSPGRLPQVEVHGQLLTVQGNGLSPLSSDDTRRIASDLIGNNKQAIHMLREQGFCDISYGLPGVARFRVNVFIQRGSCAVVMRVIPTSVPDLASLGLPLQLGSIADLHDGLVLVTGPRSSGKSSTLAALLDRINEEQICHIITIEDPIEFLHNHKRATIHQRELHSDTPSIVVGLRAALRQSPDVIMVGELRDRETMDLAIEAAETGHLVLSSLNTFDGGQAVERMASAFSASEQESVRGRLARTVRCVVCQRLVPRNDGTGRVPIAEIRWFGSREFDPPARQSDAQSLPPKKNAASTGDLDAELAKLVRAGTVDRETALNYAANPAQLREVLSR